MLWSRRDSAEGKVDAKAFKLLCKELKPKDSSMASFYDNQFKILGIDQDGLVDLGQFKKILTTTGYKMSDSNIDSFFRHIRKEESGKVKLSAILDKLSSVNVII
jgi:Ca2+-binding EF-hand superfamily protein